MICRECVINQGGKLTEGATTKQLMKCDHCGAEKYCAGEWKYGLQEKI